MQEGSSLEQLLLQVQDSFLPGLKGLVRLLLLDSHAAVKALRLCRSGQQNAEELHVTLPQPAQHAGLFAAPRGHLQQHYSL